MKRNFLVILSLLFLVACSDLKKGEQLKKVQELQTSLDSIKNSWNEADIKTIDSISAICHTTIDSISLLYDDRYVPMSLAIKLDQFKQCNQGMDELKRVHAFFPTLLVDKMQALEKLKKDIQEGKGRREKYDEYLDFEKNELITIDKQYKRYLFTKKKSFDNYSKSNEAVCQFLGELKIALAQSHTSN